MHLRQIRVRNVKLLRDVSLSFVDASGAPRMWTVLIGENGLCKTALLQAIAAATLGPRASQLVDVAAFPDRRVQDEVAIDAELGFSQDRHEHREYPGLKVKQAAPPVLDAKLRIEPGSKLFYGSSQYGGQAPSQASAAADRGDLLEQARAVLIEANPLAQARAQGIRDWFVAGYGPHRLLPLPARSVSPDDPVLQRLQPLFGAPLIGTGFADLLERSMARAFGQVLRTVLIDGGLLPRITHLELRGQGGIRSARDLVESHRFELDGGALRVPATWLSQGYQSTIAWIADLVGQIFLEAGEAVQPAEMEGLVLIDEIDVHLHPTWQIALIPALKQVFPRIQFVATTHSPMVLSGLEREEVWQMKRDGEGNVVVEKASDPPRLLTSAEIYELFFDVQRPPPGAAELQRYAFLAGDPYRTDDEDRELHEIAERLQEAGIAPAWQPVPRDTGA